MQNQPLTEEQEDQLAHRLRFLFGGLAWLFLSAPFVIIPFGIMNGPQVAFAFCLGAIYGGCAVAFGVWIMGGKR